MGIGKIFSNGNFRRFFSGHIISLVGSQVSSIALPFTAIQFLHASASDVGLLTAASFLPLVLIGLPAGAMVDRLDTRKVMLWCDFLRFILLFTVPLAYLADSLSMALLLIVALVTGTLNVIYDIAHHSVLPLIVPETQLTDGNSKLSVAYTSAEFIGPSLGGILIDWLKAPIAIAADAISYLGSFVFIYRMQMRKRTSEKQDQGKLLPQIKEGLGFLMQNPYLKPIVISMAIANFFDLFGMLKALLPIFVTRDLGLTASDYGIMIALAGIGGIIGPFVNSYLCRTFGLGKVLTATTILPGLFVLAIPLTDPKWGAIIFTLALGFGNMAVSIFNINQLTIRQLATPTHFLGRMNASVRFVIWGTIPLGALFGGYLGDAIGVRNTMIIAGVGSCLAILPLLGSPLKKLTRHEETRHQS